MSSERLFGPGHASPEKKCHHLHEYRLSCQEYEALRMRAAGRCEICGIEEHSTPHEVLLIDHHHESGEVRGLICARCNTAMACVDGTKPWGSNNRLLATRMAKYIAAVRLWAAYGQACDQMGTSRFDDMRAHIRSVVAQSGITVESNEPHLDIAPIQPPRRPGAFPRGECPVCGVEVSFRKDGKPTWHRSRLPGANDATCMASA